MTSKHKEFSVMAKNKKEGAGDGSREGGEEKEEEVSGVGIWDTDAKSLQTCRTHLIFTFYVRKLVIGRESIHNSKARNGFRNSFCLFLKTDGTWGLRRFHN